MNVDSLSVLGRLAAVVRDPDAEPTLAEQVPEVGAEVAVVVDDQDQRLAERLVDQPEERGEVDRLGNDLPGPGGERLIRGGGARIGGDQQRDRRGALLLDLAIERQAVHAGHLQVQQSDVVGPPAHQLERRRPVVGEVDRVAQVGEDVAQVAADVRVVVHDEDPRIVAACHEAAPSQGDVDAVNRIVKVLPRPGSLVTRRLP